MTRLLFFLICCAACCASSTGDARANSSARTLQGTFASARERPLTHALLRVTPLGYLRSELDFTEYAGRNDPEPILSYEREWGRLMHLIVVDDGLRRTFLHLHPVLYPDGHFRCELTLPRPGLYHLYADTTPHGFTQQVFRFSLALPSFPERHGLPNADEHRTPSSPQSRDQVPTPRTVIVGPYAVTLDSLTPTVRRGEATPLRITITKNGRPAPDLQPYLGAPAHAVFIDTRDLSYLHVHPALPGMPAGEMDDMQMPQTPVVASTLLLHVHITQPDTYKLWLQFRASGKIYVAPFILIAHE